MARSSSSRFARRCTHDRLPHGRPVAIERPINASVLSDSGRCAFSHHFRLLAVLRYVERNPLRARLVRSADEWRWGSLYRRLHGTDEERMIWAESPIGLVREWLAHVNRPQSAGEVVAIQQSVLRGSPYGNDAWQQQTAKRMGLEFTLRPRGRPKQQERK